MTDTFEVVRSPELKDEELPDIHYHNDIDQPAISLSNLPTGTDHSTLSNVTIDQHHARDHVSRHLAGGGDAFTGVYILTYQEVDTTTWAKNIIAEADSTRDLGSATKSWANLYVDTIKNTAGTTVSVTSPTTINTNSTTTLLVEQTGVKSNVLVVDTTNGRVGVNKVPTVAFDVTGAISASSTITGSNLSGTNTGDQVVPANEAGAANNFLTAYNSTTGAWTKAQPTWSNIDKTVSSLADITTKSHTVLSDIGTNTHAQIDTHIASTSNPHTTSDANLSTSDITTNNVSITKHGFTPKAPNVATQYLDGTGAWSTPAGAGGAVATDAIWDAKGDLAIGTGADTAQKLTIGSNGQLPVADSAQTVGIQWLNYPDSLSQQLLMNAGFDVWQRNTTFTFNDDTYSADRWNLLTETNGAWTCARDTDVPAGIGMTYSAKFSNVTLNNQCALVQFIENVDAVKFQGKTVTLSFYAKTNTTEIANLRAAILSWTGTADSLTSDVIGTWASDGTNPTWATSYTEENVATNKALTSSWQRFTITGILLDTASITNLAIVIWVDDGTIAATDDFYITGIMVNGGSVALPYQPKSFNDELRACQRYYEKSYNYTVVPATNSQLGQVQLVSRVADTNDRMFVKFSVTKRTTPSVTVYDSIATTAGYWYQVSGATQITTALTGVGDDGFTSYPTASTTANTQYLFQWVASAEL